MVRIPTTIEGKKIIYVEGDREGQGNAVIQFTGALSEDQNLTVIATGTVTHNQAGLAGNSSRLHIIAWSDYFETAALPSVLFLLLATSTLWWVDRH